MESSLRPGFVLSLLSLVDSTTLLILFIPQLRFHAKSVAKSADSIAESFTDTEPIATAATRSLLRL
ncbi:MAG: hypothetical protein KA250_12295 [Verrucomicrobiales bacterium]|nr:hypothetical protein [Verrucomicrobiales bacterium]MBP9225326.1 hypothetical protein [Verrucomicrobiales bacterium]